jgi:hypothetical protein
MMHVSDQRMSGRTRQCRPSVANRCDQIARFLENLELKTGTDNKGYQGQKKTREVTTCELETTHAAGCSNHHVFAAQWSRIGSIIVDTKS